MRLIDRNAQTNRWRRLPALEKAALAIGMMIAALCSPGWMAQGVVLMTCAALLLWGARIPGGDILRSASVPAGFIALSSLAQIVTLHAENGWPVPGLSEDALLPAGFIALRSLACVAALLFLALTTPLTDILRLLRRAGIGPEASDIALMMFRFIWLTLDCVESSSRSQANRLGYDGYRRSLRSLGLLLAALLPRVLNRAQRVEAGLAARGYDGELRFIDLEEKLSLARLGAAASLITTIAVIGRVGF
jgi:cobalt/nickel transport system permease protein